MTVNPIIKWVRDVKSCLTEEITCMVKNIRKYSQSH